MSRIFKLALLLTLIFPLGYTAQALPITQSELSGLNWSITNDVLGDMSGGSAFEVFGMGHAVRNNYLYVVVRTNLPSAGAVGMDSYSESSIFNPGDLYINVGGSFQNNTGKTFGIGTTSHGNVVQQAYAGETWKNIVAGKLYSNAQFATGTFERYQRVHTNYDVDDGDGSDRINSYRTLMKDGTEVAGDVSGVLYQAVANSPWAYEIYYKVSLSALGIDENGADYGKMVQLFWTMECGNDGREHFLRYTPDPHIPEPATLSLVGAAAVPFLMRRRKAT